MPASLIGGDKLQFFLRDTSRKLTSGVVRVGFLEGEMYPNESTSDRARFLKGLEKFEAGKTGPAKPGAKPTGPRANHQLRLPMPAPDMSVAQVAFWNNFGTSRTKARPFFTNMVRNQSPTWGDKLAEIVKANNYDTALSLDAMGQLIKDQLVTAIQEWPADNAPLTVAIKGFNKGLIDKGVMQRAADFEVKA